MKFGRKGIVALAAAICVALFATAAMAATDDGSLRTEIDNANTNGGTVTLEQDIQLVDGNGPIEITGTVTLDLNGYELSRNSTSARNSFVITVNGGTLTITDSSAGEAGTIKSVNSNEQNARVISIGGSNDHSNSKAGGSVVFERGTITAEGKYNYGVVLSANDTENSDKVSIDTNFTMYDGAKIDTSNNGLAAVAAFGDKCTVNIEGGEIISKYYAISGNGLPENAGTEINIHGGTITSTDNVAIYHPQLGAINITGGTLTGYDGIQMCGGTLVMTGGIIKAIGTGKHSTDSYNKGSDGSIATGCALSLLSRAGYTGDINVNISGTSTLTSSNNYAVVEAFADGYAIPETVSVVITNGTFKSIATGQDAVAFVNKDKITTFSITGGTYSSNVSEYLDEGVEMARDENGNYYVVVNAESIAFKLETLELAMNETAILEVVFTPDNTTEKALTWSSSDEKVATVDADGNITPVAPGTTTITAALADNGSVYASCTVTVTNDVKPQPSGSGGGCSAGFGALALLAALPLLRMKKK